MVFNILFKQIKWRISKIQDPVLMPCFMFGASLSHISEKLLTAVQAYTDAQLEEAALNGTWTVS